MRYSGRFEEALELIKKAIRLSPIHRAFYTVTLATAYLKLERYEEAIAVSNQLIERWRMGECPPSWGYTSLIEAYMGLGREEEARAKAEEFLKIQPTYSLEGRPKKNPYRDRAHLERTLSALRKAGLPDKPPLPLPDKPSIAVLPFVNMSGDPEQEYLSDGITESIITGLSKTPKLFVIARNSTFTYKGKPANVQKVGRELGVRYVLEGSVQKSGDRLRITAQLVDAKSGNHIWAERYDRELRDFFALQDEITMKILTALRVKLTHGEQARLWAKVTNNLNAYLKQSKAREYLLRGTRDDNVMARQLAQETIALDPDCPSGYVTLAATHLMDILYGATKSPGKSIEKASELVQKALALDDSYFYAHNIVGRIYLMKRQYDKAIAQYERALELNPNVADAYALYGLTLNYVSRPEEAIELFKKAIRLNPIPPCYYLSNLAYAYRMVGQYEDAIATLKKALDRTPDNLWANVYFTATYSEAGRLNEARAQAAEVLRIQPKFSAEGFAKKMPYKYKADAERLIDAVRKAGLK